MKKLFIIPMVIILLTCMNVRAMAERRVYSEYEHEDGEPYYGPTVGYQWDIDPLWMMALEFQLPGSGENDASLAAEITRRLYVNLTSALRMELGDSKNSFRFKVNGDQNSGKLFQFEESLSYTMNHFSNSASDYSEFELYGEINNILNAKWRLGLEGTWTQINYPNAEKSGLNYKKWEIIPKVKFLPRKELELDGGYSWNDNTKISEIKRNYVVGAKYYWKNYNFYCEFEFPTARSTSTIGASYQF